MPPKAPKRVILFVGDEIARKCDIAFSDVAKRMGLPYQSRHLTTLTLDQSAEAYHTITFTPLDGISGDVEVWSIVPGEIDAEISALVARLLGGTRGEPAPPRTPPETTSIPKKGAIVKVGRETAGRRGKGVTTIWELPLSAEELQALATKLKERCGTGGTVKDGRIEIQGDQRDKISQELESMGYRVKRVGG